MISWQNRLHASPYARAAALSLKMMITNSAMTNYANAGLTAAGNGGANMNRTRDWRRAQRTRIKSKRRRQLMEWARPDPDGWIEWYLPRFSVTPHPCSCIGCGNQRKHDGPTIQERRHSAEM